MSAILCRAEIGRSRWKAGNRTRLLRAQLNSLQVHLRIARQTASPPVKLSVGDYANEGHALGTPVISTRDCDGTIIISNWAAENEVSVWVEEQCDILICNYHCNWEEICRAGETVEEASISWDWLAQILPIKGCDWKSCGRGSA